MIRAVIFDVMAVVFKVGDDTNDLLIPYVLSVRPGVPRELILAKYLEASLGKISASQLWMSLGFPQGDIEAVQRAYLDKYVIDEEFITCASQLKTRYTLALLSNDILEWSLFLRRKFCIDSLIDRAFISSDLGLRKPDPRIYLKALQDLGLPAYECLFIDDYPERVEVAQKQGMASILFNRQDHVYRGLQVKSFDQITRLLL